MFRKNQNSRNNDLSSIVDISGIPKERLLDALTIAGREINVCGMRFCSGMTDGLADMVANPKADYKKAKQDIENGIVNLSDVKSYQGVKINAYLSGQSVSFTEYDASHKQGLGAKTVTQLKRTYTKKLLKLI